MIRFFNVSKIYPGRQVALDEVSFDIAKGEFVFLTGPSGAGKTTLLKMLFREDEPSNGQILVNGRNVASIPRSKIPYLRRTIGVVFQNFRLIHRKTVFENVAYLPRILGLDRSEQRRLAYQALHKVGLSHRAESYPQELSGGEQQRVAIARALISDPELLIADEPSGNLDPDLSFEILKLFLDINRRGTTVLLATHDRSIIERVGGRVLTLNRGRVVRDVMIDGCDPILATARFVEPAEDDGPPGSSLASEQDTDSDIEEDSAASQELGERDEAEAFSGTALGAPYAAAKPVEDASEAEARRLTAPGDDE